MPAHEFDINVAFNASPELDTNPRGAIMRVHRDARGVGPNLAYDTLFAFNQNVAHPGLTNYRVDPATPVRPLWAVQVTPVGNGARVVISAPTFAIPIDSVVTSEDLWQYGGGPIVGPGPRNGLIRILADCTNPNDCYDFGGDSVAPKRFDIPWTLTVARGLATPFDTLTLTARDTTTQVIDVPLGNLGPGSITGLQLANYESAPWISYEVLAGGTATPAVMRVTVHPALAPPLTSSHHAILISGRGEYQTFSGTRQEIQLNVVLHRLFP